MRGGHNSTVGIVRRAAAPWTVSGRPELVVNAAIGCRGSPAVVMSRPKRTLPHHRLTSPLGPHEQGRSNARVVARRVRTISVQMLRLVIIGATVVVVSWVVMIGLARRLPPGLAKDLATILPACVTTARRLRRDSRVPRRVKVVVAFAGLWVLSPIDLIPEFLPVIGPLDDVVVVALALRYAARRIPPEALIDAWPADRRILDRLVPGAKSSSSPDGPH